jgi:hypothetical protein
MKNFVIRFCAFLLVFTIGFAGIATAQDQDIPLQYDSIYKQMFNGGETKYFTFEGKAGDVVSVQALEVEDGFVEDIRLNDSKGREVGINSSFLSDKFVIADLTEDGTYFISVTAGDRDTPCEYMILVSKTGYLVEGEGIHAVQDAELFNVLFLINPAKTGRYTISYDVTTELAPDFTIAESCQYCNWVFNVNPVSRYVSGTVTLELERFGMYIGAVHSFGRMRGIGEMNLTIEAVKES